MAVEIVLFGHFMEIIVEEKESIMLWRSDSLSIEVKFLVTSLVPCTPWFRDISTTLILTSLKESFSHLQT